MKGLAKQKLILEKRDRFQNSLGELHCPRAAVNLKGEGQGRDVRKDRMGGGEEELPPKRARKLKVSE